MIASRTTAKRPSMGFKMPKTCARVVCRGRGCRCSCRVDAQEGRKSAADAPAAQAQLPLGDGKRGANIEFSGSSQPVPLPLGGQSQPVMREPRPRPQAWVGRRQPGWRYRPAAWQPAADRDHHRPAAGVAAGPRRRLRNPCSRLRLRKTGRNPACRLRAAPAPTQVAVGRPPSLLKTSRWRHWQQQLVRRPETGQLRGANPGTSSEASAQAYVKAQGGDYRYFKKDLQGKPLYVVTYGSFASRDAAVAAIKNLPAKVQAGKPWPRTVASVQQELASAR